MSTRKKWAVTVNNGERVSQRSQSAAYDYVRAQAALPTTEIVKVFVDEGDGYGWALYDDLRGADLLAMGRR